MENALVVELAEEQGLDPDGAKKLYDSYGKGEVWEIDSQEWLIFDDSDDAYDGAIEYVKQTYADEPSIFSADLLRDFAKVAPGDIDEIAAETGDNDAENMDDDDLLREADNAPDEDDFTNADGDLDEAAYEAAVEKAVDEAKEIVSEHVAKEVAKALRDDPIGWWEDIVGKGEKLPDWIGVDVAALAEHIVDNDGVGHTLGSYDGNDIELPSGAVAIRLN
jgi:hypothetical protein